MQIFIYIKTYCYINIKILRKQFNTYNDPNVDVQLRRNINY